MSVETAKKFIQKARSDQKLQAKLQAASSGTKEQKMAAIVRIAGEAGFAITAADYDEAIKADVGRQHAAGELSEDELGAVAGGLRRANGNTRCDCTYPNDCSLTK